MDKKCDKTEADKLAILLKENKPRPAKKTDERWKIKPKENRQLAT